MKLIVIEIPVRMIFQISDNETVSDKMILKTLLNENGVKLYPHLDRVRTISEEINYETKTHS